MGRVPEPRFGEPIFRAEVIVQERLIDARFPGDLFHASPGGPSAEKDRVRGVHDELLGAAVELDAGCCAFRLH